jgi:hypothetical protein
MKLKLIYSVLLMGLIFAACEDPELDPLQYDKIKKGSILGLRGTSFDNLFEDAYATGVDTFSIIEDNSGRTFKFDVDFVSESQSSLASIDVFVVKKDGSRAKIANIPASEFKPTTGTNFNRANVSIPFNTIFNASGFAICDFSPSSGPDGIYSFIQIENDINLSDGTIVPASAIVNTSLSESTILYPGHNLRYIAKGPYTSSSKFEIKSGDTLDVDLLNALSPADAGATFAWSADANDNIDGETSASSSSNKISDILVNTTTKRQTVTYNVAPKLGNGCNGTPYTVTVVVLAN